MQVPTLGLLNYHAARKPMECELDVQPYRCEFWPLDELEKINLEYGVPTYAPGFLGFATSGGGEMLALSPSHEIVCLPFIGMAPAEALPVAKSWKEFEALLRAW